MKTLVIVLSAAVVVGLAAYFGFDGANQIGLLGSNVTMRIDAFIAFIVCLCIGSAAVALGFRAAVARADRGLVAALEQRLAKLEQRSGPN